MPWGPWKDHDGTHRPVEKGDYVHVAGEYDDGDVVKKRFIVSKDSYAWYWFNYGRDYGGGSIAKILRYRMWQRPSGKAKQAKQPERVTA